jgi:general nucleoside transport system permease protein
MPWLASALPALAVVGFVLGAILLSLMGTHPWEAYQEMARGAFGSVYSLSETLVKATPLLLAVLAGGLAFPAGFWNIGAEGQLYIGAMARTWAALTYPGLPALILQSLMIGVECLAGALWGLVPAVLRVSRGANEIITTLMLNYIAILWVDFLVYGPWKEPQAFGFPFTPPVPQPARLPTRPGSRVHLGLLLGGSSAHRTRPGLKVRVAGEQPQSADAMGISVVAVRYGCVLSGGLAAGLAGAYRSLAYTPMWVDNMTAGRAWIALGMVIFGAWDPVRTALGADLFGGVQAFQLRLQATGIAIPTYLLMMAPYGFTILALIIASGARARRRLGTPAALGTPYIRGK